MVFEDLSFIDPIEAEKFPQAKPTTPTQALKRFSRNFEVGCGGAGYTAAGEAWTGPRDWSQEQYGPGADCIVTWLEEMFCFSENDGRWLMATRKFRNKRKTHQLRLVNVPFFTGFYVSQVVQDFFHQQYEEMFLVKLARDRIHDQFTHKWVFFFKGKSVNISRKSRLVNYSDLTSFELDREDIHSFQVTYILYGCFRK